MPRNGEDRPVDTIIAARVDGAYVRCGHCGQGLWPLEDDGARLVSSTGGPNGWRFIDGVWRPSSYQAQWSKNSGVI